MNKGERLAVNAGLKQRDDLIVKYQAALQKIDRYTVDRVKASDELKTSTEECPECRDAKVCGWPPSGLCNNHYSRWHREVLGENEARENRQHINLREIAHEALQETNDVGPTHPGSQ